MSLIAVKRHSANRTYSLPHSCQDRPCTDNYKNALTFLKGNHVETLTAETTGQDILPIEEYAANQGVSRRTVNRYAEQGRIETIRRNGRTFVIDRTPSEIPKETEHAKRVSRLDTESGHLAKTPDNYLFRLGELTALARTRQRWQVLAIVLLVMLVVALVVIAGGGAYGFQHMQSQAVIIEGAAAALASMEVSLAGAKQTASESTTTTSRAILELTAAVGRLTGEISQLQSENARLTTVNARLTSRLAAERLQDVATGRSGDDLPVSDPNSH